MKQLDIKELSGLFNITGGRRSDRSGYEDFVELFAIQISNKVDPVHYQEREGRAAAIKERYSADELKEMNRYQAIFTDILKRQVELGTYPNICSILSYELGNFTQSEEPTPDDVSELLNAIALGARKSKSTKNDMQHIINEKGFFTIADDTAGTGSLIIATAKEANKHGINYCTKMVALCVEKKSTLLHQCYIQLALYGIPAVVIHGDSLVVEEYTRWYTPMYILGDWVWRCPMGMTDGRNVSDELLKMHQEPMYRAIRQMEGWFTEPDEKEGA